MDKRARACVCMRTCVCMCACVRVRACMYVDKKFPHHDILTLDLSGFFFV